MIKEREIVTISLLVGRKTIENTITDFEELLAKLKNLKKRGYDIMSSSEQELSFTFEKTNTTIEAISPSDITPEVLDRSIEELDLSIRSYNCLKNLNIKTLRELISKSRVDLLGVANFGRRSLTEIEELLHRMGLSLRK